MAMVRLQTPAVCSVATGTLLLNSVIFRLGYPLLQGTTAARR
jgi:hypothetical protein